MIRSRYGTGDPDGLTQATRKALQNKDVVHTYQHQRENKLDMKSMSRDHLDVLQNIEFTLVNAARRTEGMDDRVVDEALGLALRGREPGEDADALAVAVYEMLEEMRAFREDVPDNIWHAGLKTVRQSARRHSTPAPGENSYLRFVEKDIR